MGLVCRTQLIGWTTGHSSLILFRKRGSTIVDTTNQNVFTANQPWSRSQFFRDIKLEARVKDSWRWVSIPFLQILVLAGLVLALIHVRNYRCASLGLSIDACIATQETDFGITGGLFAVAAIVMVLVGGAAAPRANFDVALATFLFWGSIATFLLLALPMRWAYYLASAAGGVFALLVGYRIWNQRVNARHTMLTKMLAAFALILVIGFASPLLHIFLNPTW